LSKGKEEEKMGLPAGSEVQRQRERERKSEREREIEFYWE